MNESNVREAYGIAIAELGIDNRGIVVLDADLGSSTRTVHFEKNFPDRFFEMGIAEQNMMGCAAGLAIAGKIPFVNTFAVFATGRCYDQIRQSICVPRLNVKICGSSCGLSDYGDGSTHQAIDDIAIMRALPNMTVLAPCDSVETRQMVRAMVDHEGPMYMRVSRSSLPVYCADDAPFEWGVPRLIRNGGDIVVFAHGSMIEKAMVAAEMLDAERVSLRVVNVSTIKPLDRESIGEFAESMRGMIVAEEHSVIGGLGSAILDSVPDHPPFRLIGVRDEFGTSARDADELMEAYGLTSQAIYSAAKSLLGK